MLFPFYKLGNQGLGVMNNLFSHKDSKNGAWHAKGIQNTGGARQRTVPRHCNPESELITILAILPLAL